MKKAVGKLEFPSKKEVEDLNERVAELEKQVNGMRSNMNLMENKINKNKGGGQVIQAGVGGGASSD